MANQVQGNSPPLSTAEFYRELTEVDFTAKGPRTRIYSVQLDTEALLGALSLSKGLVSISSTDGAISHVKENPLAASDDNSASSRYFSLHTDGKYLPQVPEMVILHCVDPGSSEIPTVFVDTKDILDILAKIGRLDEAAEYNHTFTNRDGIDFVRPLVETGKINKEPVMNIAVASPQCRLHPITGSSKTQPDADHFYDLLEQIVAEDVSVMSHTWSQNDAIIFDNLRLVHGRGLPEHKALQAADARRYLHRIWLSRR